MVTIARKPTETRVLDVKSNLRKIRDTLTLPRILSPALGPNAASASSRHLERLLALSCTPIGATVYNRTTSPQYHTPSALVNLDSSARAGPCSSLGAVFTIDPRASGLDTAFSVLDGHNSAFRGLSIFTSR
ncbi:unnamed protein product [Peniophora sp. CBMAI 1063]|nr:unnamed protein product [Peniophora sp. CBMAI 1063]